MKMKKFALYFLTSLSLTICQEDVVEPEPPKDPTKETILQTSRLFLRNLAFTCTESDLMDLFKRFGEISQVSHLLYFDEGEDEKSCTGTSDSS